MSVVIPCGTCGKGKNKYRQFNSLGECKYCATKRKMKGRNSAYKAMVNERYKSYVQPSR